MVLTGCRSLFPMGSVGGDTLYDYLVGRALMMTFMMIWSWVKGLVAGLGILENISTVAFLTL